MIFSLMMNKIVVFISQILVKEKESDELDDPPVADTGIWGRFTITFITGCTVSMCLWQMKPRSGYRGMGVRKTVKVTWGLPTGKGGDTPIIP